MTGVSAATGRGDSRARATPARFDRMMRWVPPLVALLTPLAVMPAFARFSQGQMYFFQAAVMAAGAALGVGWILLRRPSCWVITLPGLLGGVFFASMAISVFASGLALFSLKQALPQAAGLVLFILLTQQPGRRMLIERTLIALSIVAGGLAAYGVLQHFGLDLLDTHKVVFQKNPVIGTLGHPNYLSAVLGPMVFVLAGWFPELRRRSHRIALGLVVMVVLACILLARTRGIWLSLALSGLATVLLTARPKHGIHARSLWKKHPIAILVLLGVVVMAALAPGIDFGRRLSSTQEIKSRLFYWRAAIDQAFERPLAGHGPGTFDPAFWDYVIEHRQSGMAPFFADVLPAISGSNPGHVHNEYLEIFHAQGLPGILAFLWLVGFFLYVPLARMLSLRRRGSRPLREACLYGALFTSLMHAGFSFPWHLPVSLIVFVTLLAWHYDRLYPRQRALEVRISSGE